MSGKGKDASVSTAENNTTQTQTRCNCTDRCAPSTTLLCVSAICATTGVVVVSTSPIEAAIAFGWSVLTGFFGVKTCYADRETNCSCFFGNSTKPPLSTLEHTGAETPPRSVSMGNNSVG